MAEAMSSEHEGRDRDDRSRSPARGAPNEAVPTEVKEGETGEQGALGGHGQGLEDPKPESEKVPGQDAHVPAEENTARGLLDTIIESSKSLQACAIQLESCADQLGELQSDSKSIQSLVAGVNYYASTTKAAQAAQSASHKQLAWDWLSSSSDKQPLKDTLKSMRYHCECTSKAAYHLVETTGNILEELKGQKTVMSEQCTLLKTIAANQVELSKLMNS